MNEFDTLELIHICKLLLWKWEVVDFESERREGRVATRAGYVLAQLFGCHSYSDLCREAHDKPEIIHVLKMLQSDHGYTIYKALAAKRGLR